MNKISRYFNVSIDALLNDVENNIENLIPRNDKNKIIIYKPNGGVETYILSDEDINAFDAILKKFINQNE